MEDSLEGSRRQSRNCTRDSILPFDMPEDDGELGANVTQGSILLTPDLDAPFSQFQIPMRGEAKNPLGAQTLGQPQQGKQGARQKISKVTEIFRRILEDAFVSSGKKLGARFAGHGTVTFNSALKDAVADELLSVKDVAISFVQLLSLKSLNVIDIQQEVPYGAIAISKGPQWKHHARRVDDVFLSPSQEL